MELTEKEVEALKKVTAEMGDMVKNWPGVIEDLSKVKLLFGKLEEVDILKSIEKINAQHDSLVAAIKTSKDGLYIPGLEGVKRGEGKGEFSLLRLAGAIARRDEKLAPYEMELVKAVRDKWYEKTAQTNIDSRGGFFVPDQLIADVIISVFARSAFLTIPGGPEGTTRVQMLDGLIGDPVRIPKFNRSMVANWVGERAVIPESDQPDLGMITLSPKKLTVLATITEEMIARGGFGFEGLFRDDMVRALGEKLDFSIMFGAGNDNEPRGIFNLDVTEFSHETGLVQSAGGAARTDPVDSQGGEVSFEVLENMVGALEDANHMPDESFAIIAAPRYWRKLRQLKISSFSGQTSEKAILLGLPFISQARLAEIIGHTLDQTTQIPTTNLPGASAGWPTTDTSPGDDKFSDVFLGNWREFVFARWAGIEFVSDDGKGDTTFARDEMRFKMRMFVDHTARQQEAIVVSPDVKVRD